jgi:hypothetical protein
MDNWLHEPSVARMPTFRRSDRATVEVVRRDPMVFERVQKALEGRMLEIAPLAFIRGRTLNYAFVILDEAQETTRKQMKMSLTRNGFGSKAMVHLSRRPRPRSQARRVSLMPVEPAYNAAAQHLLWEQTWNSRTASP